MKCEKCGTEMKIDKLTPRGDRRFIGKQYFKMKCPVCGEIKFVKPSELRKE